jgi:hypothetical protein
MALGTEQIRFVLAKGDIITVGTSVIRPTLICSENSNLSPSIVSAKIEVSKYPAENGTIEKTFAVLFVIEHTKQHSVELMPTRKSQTISSFACAIVAETKDANAISLFKHILAMMIILL